jgi:hypothetical protein
LTNPVSPPTTVMRWDEDKPFLPTIGCPPKASQKPEKYRR